MHALFLALVATLSEMLGTISGFGSSTFFVPFALRFESFAFVLALTALLHCLGNSAKVFLFREQFDRKVLLRFAIPSIVFTGIGALLSSVVQVELLKLVLGIFLILFGLVSLFGAKTPRPQRPVLQVIVMCLSGLFTGMIGTGGALRGAALSRVPLTPQQFVLMSALIDFGGDFLRASIYISKGYMDWSQAYYLPILLVAAWTGTWIGKRVLSKISGVLFRKIVAVFVLLSGLSLTLGI